MASGSDASWERYIIRDSKQSILRLRKTRDADWLAWTDKWHRMYYDYRRQYENWALFGIEKLSPGPGEACQLP